MIITEPFDDNEELTNIDVDMWGDTMYDPDDWWDGEADHCHAMAHQEVVSQYT